MKKEISHVAVLVAAVLLPLSLRAAEGGADAVRDRVWSRYLSDSEQAALRKSVEPQSVPEGNGAEQSPEEMIAAMREGFHQFITAQAPLLESVPREEVEMGPVRGTWYNPPAANPEQVLLHFHGGGFIVGSSVTGGAVAGFLAEAAGIRCFSLDYPLAPEAPYPAAHENAVMAYCQLIQDGFKPENIVLAGDSAGGNLVLGTLLRIRDRNLPMPAGGYMLSPWTDLTNTQSTMRTKALVDPSLTPDSLAMMSSSYAPGHDLADPALSPAYADLAGLPPLYIQAGTHEILLDDALIIAKNAALADVPVTLSVWPGYGHVFQYAYPSIAAGRKALLEGAKFFQEVLSGHRLE